MVLPSTRRQHRPRQRCPRVDRPVLSALRARLAAVGCGRERHRRARGPSSLEGLTAGFPHVPPEAVLKEDLLRTGIAFDDSALTRQPRRRGQAEVVLHLLVRPEAARRARRGGAAPAARGDRADRRAVRAAPHDRLRAGEPGLAVPRRALGRRRAAALARRPRARRRRPAADARVLPPPARERQDGDGDGADDPVGLPDLPHRAAPLPVLRRATRSAASATSTTTGASTSRRAGPYTGVKPVEDVLEALALIDRYDTRRATRPRTRSPAARSRRTVDGLAEADFYGRYAQAIEERFPGRWIGKVVAQALPKADVQRFKDYGITIYHPNYEVWDKRLFSLISPGQGALRRPRGVAPADLRRGGRLRPELRDPELRRRRRDGEAVRVRDRRRGDRVDDRGPRLLHVARDHAALHDLVPGADDAARPRQPGRRAARVPHPAARRLRGRARPPRPRAAARLRRRRAPATRSSRSRPSWTRSTRWRRERRISVERGARALARGLRRRAEAAARRRCARASTSPTARPTWSCGSSTTRTSASPSATTAPSTSCRTRTGGYVLSRDEVFAKIDELLEVGGDLVALQRRLQPAAAARLLLRPLRRGARALRRPRRVLRADDRRVRLPRRPRRALVRGRGARGCATPASTGSRAAAARSSPRTSASGTRSSSTRCASTSRRSARSSRAACGRPRRW